MSYSKRIFLTFQENSSRLIQFGKSYSVLKSVPILMQLALWEKHGLKFGEIAFRDTFNSWSILLNDIIIEYRN